MNEKKHKQWNSEFLIDILVNRFIITSYDEPTFNLQKTGK